MGVDTQLYISKRWTVEDVRDVLTKRMGLKVETRFHDFAPDYIQLYITIGNEMRTLNVHTDTSMGGFPAMNLNFRSNEQGINLLRELAKSFGGMFAEEDCSGTFEEIQAPDDGDAGWVLKQCIKKDPQAGSDLALLSEMIRTEGWK